MRTQHQTITLTVLGGDPSLTDGVRGCDYVGRFRETGGRKMDARRALLVIRPDDDAHRLKRRLRDSITRLAGGAAADAGRLAGQIMRELQRARRADTAHRGWTLAHNWEGPRKDPYAPRLSRLRLIDTPTRRGYITQRLRRSAGLPHEQSLRHSTRISATCLS